MVSADMCEHDWPGSSCPECRAERNARRAAALAKPASKPAGGGVLDALRIERDDLRLQLASTQGQLAAALDRAKSAEEDGTRCLTRLDAALSSSAGPAEPVAWAPKDHLQRYLKGQNTACWVYGSPTSETDVALFAHPAPATVEMLTEAAKAGWNACRKSIYAVCEDVISENERHREDTENPPRHHFGRGGMTAAKSIARGFNSMEAEDDDNFTAARAALAPATEGRKG